MKFKYIFSAAALAVMFSSCNDMLEKSPYGQFTSEQFDADGIEGLMSSAYAGLEAHFLGNNEAFSGPMTNWIFDVRSDDALKGGGSISMEENIHQIELNNILATNPSCLFKWENAYFAIARVHTALKNMDLVANEQQRKEYTAQLHFLRAFYYFDLYRLFERFPYFTENDDPSTVSAKQYSRAEIYGFIISDLQDAWNNLPVNYPSKPGAANKYAAAAMLARVYAYESDWANVEKYSDAVIKSGQYSLYDNFGDMSQIKYNNTHESIFALQCSNFDDNFHINWSNLLNVTYSKGNLYGGGDDFFLASQNLVDAFRTNDNGLPYLDNYAPKESVDHGYSGSIDPRLDFTVGRPGHPWRDNGTNKYIYEIDGWCRAYKDYGPYSGKKWCIDPDDSMCLKDYPYSSPLNFIFIRYADILLLHAEALIEQNKDLGIARDRINEIRRKAIRSGEDYNYRPKDLDWNQEDYYVQEYPSAGWSQDYARKAVRMERRLELAMEGGRWFDLCRWGVVKETMDAYFKYESAFQSYYDGVKIKSDNIFMPIPLSEVENANGLYD